jgi:hypothetical protein
MLDTDLILRRFKIKDMKIAASFICLLREDSSKSWDSQISDLYITQDADPLVEKSLVEFKIGNSRVRQQADAYQIITAIIRTVCVPIRD